MCTSMCTSPVEWKCWRRQMGLAGGVYSDRWSALEFKVWMAGLGVDGWVTGRWGGELPFSCWVKTNQVLLGHSHSIVLARFFVHTVSPWDPISFCHHSSLLTPHSSLLTPHSSLLTPHSSDPRGKGPTGQEPQPQAAGAGARPQLPLRAVNGRVRPEQQWDTGVMSDSEE